MLKSRRPCAFAAGDEDRPRKAPATLASVRHEGRMSLYVPDRF